MKGIADGAAAAGAKFEGRPLDLARHRRGQLRHRGRLPRRRASRPRPTASKAGSSASPPDHARRAPHAEHCSAFAATGPATADGQIVFGHITMFNLYFVRHFNVWLDVKPDQGPPRPDADLPRRHPERHGLLPERRRPARRRDHHRPDQVRHRRRRPRLADPQGAPVRRLDRRGRRRSSTTANNGLYTNEWLLADTKTNEIAMFELGTHKSKLWRSSKDEWFGGTKGFYWGCNNAKDLRRPARDGRQRRGQAGQPGLSARPTATGPGCGSTTKHKGKIDADFGFEAFTTPPLAAFPSLRRQVHDHRRWPGSCKTWALFGPPLGRTWEPVRRRARSQFPASGRWCGNDWTVLTAERPSPIAAEALAGRTIAVPPAADRSHRPRKPDRSTADFADASYGVSTSRRPSPRRLARDDPARSPTPTSGSPPRSPTTRRSSPARLALQARAKAKERALNRAEKDGSASPCSPRIPTT